VFQFSTCLGFFNMTNSILKMAFYLQISISYFKEFHCKCNSSLNWGFSILTNLPIQRGNFYISQYNFLIYNQNLQIFEHVYNYYMRLNLWSHVNHIMIMWHKFWYYVNEHVTKILLPCKLKGLNFWSRAKWLCDLQHFGHM